VTSDELRVDAWLELAEGGLPEKGRKLHVVLFSWQQWLKLEDDHIY
jgi:hypothetical protein